MKTAKNPYKWRAENGILCIYNFSWVTEIIDKSVNGGSGGLRINLPKTPITGQL